MATTRRILIDDQNPSGTWTDPDFAGYQYQFLNFNSSHYVALHLERPIFFGGALRTDVYVWQGGYITFTAPSAEQIAFAGHDYYQIDARGILELPGNATLEAQGVKNTSDFLSTGKPDDYDGSYQICVQNSARGLFIAWGDPIEDPANGDTFSQNCGELLIKPDGSYEIDFGSTTNGQLAYRESGLGYLQGGLLIGGDGPDHLVGYEGFGFDVADYYREGGAIDVDLASGTVISARGNDTLTSVEDVRGTPFGDILRGSSIAYGVEATYPDVIKPSTVVNSATNAQGIGQFGGGYDPEIQDSTIAPHATVVATGSGVVEYYAFLASGPSVIRIDIDHADFDTSIRLIDSTYFGTVIAQNDNSAFLDAGSVLLAGRTTNSDSFIEFKTNEYNSGFYYFAISQSGGGAVPVGSHYTLNVSVSPITDALYGGEGDDKLVSGAANDHLDGGLGFDIVSFEGAQIGVIVDLIAGTAAGHGLDTLYSVEHVIGSAFSDTLRGGPPPTDIRDRDYSPATFTSLASALSLDEYFSVTADSEIFSSSAVPHVTVAISQTFGTPRPGNSFEYYSFNVTDANSFVTLDIDHASFDTVIRILDSNGQPVAGAENDDNNVIDSGSTSTLDSFLQFLVTAPGQYYAEVSAYYNNSVPAGAAYTLNVSVEKHSDYWLSGGAGDDWLLSGDGWDKLEGGDGNDTASFRNATGAIIASLTTGVATGQGQDRLVQVENLEGGAFTDQLTGDASANELRGGAGNDVLTGFGGNDVLFGGTGADTMTGGLGNDIFFVDSAGDIVTEAPNEGYETVFSSVNFTLPANVERALVDGVDQTFAINLIGNTLANELGGNAGPNVLDGGAGADLMTGYTGNDVYFVDNGGDVIIEGVNAGFDTVFAIFNYTLGDNVERVVTLDPSSTAPLNFTGNSLNNEMTGNAGANILDGGAGADLMIGGAGNDIYFVDNTGDIVSDAPGGGYDTVFTTTNFLLNSLIERVVALDNNSPTHVTLIGNEFANEITGSGGSNLIDGGLGADLLMGGAGSDAFRFSTTLGSANIDALPDFQVGTDKIYLDHAIFAALSAGSLTGAAFRAGTSAADADDRIIYDPASGKLYYDADGNGAGGAVQFAVLHEGLNLSAGDFYVV